MNIYAFLITIVILIIIVITTYNYGKKNKIGNDLILFKSNMTFYFLSFFLISISNIVYYNVSEKFTDVIFFSSGLVLPIWLLVTGVIIRWLFKLMVNLSKPELVDIKKQDKTIILIICSLLFLVSSFFIETKLFFIVLAIILGRFMWIDTTWGIFKEILDIFRLTTNTNRVTLVLNIIIFSFCFFSKKFIGNGITIGIFFGLVCAVTIILIVIIVNLTFRRFLGRS